MGKSSDPVIFWTISCFDKRRENPLPLYNRTFALDWSALSPTERAEVLAILDDPSKRSKYSPKGFDTTIVTVEQGATSHDRRMLKFRSHFKLLPGDEFKKLWQERPGEMRQAHITGEYFEDEAGKPISMYQMMQHVSGQEKPIIMGDARSVLALGPSSPRATEEWTVVTANTIAQFIQVIRKITASNWHRGRKSITYEVESGAHNSAAAPTSLDRRLLEAIFPNADETTAVLAYFRQLHAKDRLFERAADAYLNHCNDDVKRAWVEHEKRAFIAAIDRPPGLLETKRTNRRIIQLFMYGAGLLHSTSNDGADVELADFISEHGKERAVSIFHNCLVDMFWKTVPTFHVIKQDFEHWLANCSLAVPDRKAIDDLFATYVVQADNQ